MAVYNKTELKTRIDSNVTDNTSGAITGAVLNSELTNVVDSLFSTVASISALKSYDTTNLNDGDRLLVRNTDTANTDDEGAIYRWDSSSTLSDDGVDVINPTGNTGAGRLLSWTRQFTTREKLNLGHISGGEEPLSIRGQSQLSLPMTATKYSGNPVFRGSDATWTGEEVFWFQPIHVEDLISNPIDKFYAYYSTDHSAGAGGIGLATSPDGINWTDYGSNPVYQDSVAGDQTETPSIIWNEDTSEFYMYYHNDAVGYGQSTVLATSSDGLSWTRYGKVIDVVRPDDYYGTHTGYAMVCRSGRQWIAYHLMGGGGVSSFFGISYSNDGLDWYLDPRPLVGNNQHILSDRNKRLSQRMRIFKWGGDLWAVVNWGDVTSFGVADGTSKLYAIRLSPDGRRFIGKPYVLINNDSSYDLNGVKTYGIMSYNGKLYIYYEAINSSNIQTIALATVQ